MAQDLLMLDQISRYTDTGLEGGSGSNGLVLNSAEAGVVARGSGISFS